MFSARPIALALTTIFCGCLPMPRPVPLTAVKSPQIAVPPAPADGSMFGYLKFRDLSKLATGLGADKLAAVRGLKLDDLRLGQATAAFLWDPGLGFQRIPLVALIPAPLTSSLMSAVSALIGKDHLKEIGSGYSLLTLTPDGAQEAHDPQALLSLTERPMDADVQMYIQMRAVMDRYGTMMETMLAAMPLEGKSSTDSQKAMATMVRGLMRSAVEWVKGLDLFSIGFSELPTEKEMTFLTKERGVQASTAVRQTGNLIKFLPAADIRVQTDNWNTSALFNLMTQKIYGPLMPAPLFKRFDALFGEFAKDSGASHAAASLSFTGGKFQMLNVTLWPNAAKQMETTRQLNDLMSDPAFTEVFRQLGMAMTYKAQRNARKHAGISVDRYEFHSQPTNGTNAQQMELERTFGSYSVEWMRVGPYLVTAMNQTPTALDALADALISGQGNGASLKSSASFPGGGFFYCDIDMKRLVDDLRSIFPNELKFKQLTLPDGIPPITVSGYESGDLHSYRLRVPHELENTFK